MEVAGFIQVFNNMLKKSWLVLFSLLILSCNREEIADLGLDYFPIDSSLFRVYDVVETTYVNGVENIENYQLRESISDQIEINVTSYVLLIERRDDPSENWRSIETIAIRRTNRILEYREGNKSFLKLSFPVSDGRIWDGNANNDDTEAIYIYYGLDQEIPFNNNEHIKVIISDLPANIVEQDERFEIYGKGIGLVERDFKQITFCQQDCSGINEPQDGAILNQRLIEYGSF